MWNNIIFTTWARQGDTCSSLKILWPSVPGSTHIPVSYRLVQMCIRDRCYQLHFPHHIAVLPLPTYHWLCDPAKFSTIAQVLKMECHPMPRTPIWWRQACLLTVVPVSYTHLDVYKRQVYAQQHCVVYPAFHHDIYLLWMPMCGQELN